MDGPNQIMEIGNKRIRADIVEGERNVAVDDQDLDTIASCVKFFKKHPVWSEDNLFNHMGEAEGSWVHKLVSVAEGSIMNIGCSHLPAYGFMEGMYVERTHATSTLRVDAGAAVDIKTEKIVVLYYFQRKFHPKYIINGENDVMLLHKVATVGDYIMSLHNKRAKFDYEQVEEFAQALCEATTLFKTHTQRKNFALQASAWLMAPAPNNSSIDIVDSCIASLKLFVNGKLEECLKLDYEVLGRSAKPVLSMLLTTRYASSSLIQLVQASHGILNVTMRSMFYEQSQRIFLPFTASRGLQLTDKAGVPLKPMPLIGLDAKLKVLLSTKPATSVQLREFGTQRDRTVYVMPTGGFFKKNGEKSKVIAPFIGETDTVKHVLDLKKSMSLDIEVEVIDEAPLVDASAMVSSINLFGDLDL